APGVSSRDGPATLDVPGKEPSPDLAESAIALAPGHRSSRLPGGRPIWTAAGCVAALLALGIVVRFSAIFTHKEPSLTAGESIRVVNLLKQAKDYLTPLGYGSHRPKGGDLRGRILSALDKAIKEVEDGHSPEHDLGRALDDLRSLEEITTKAYKDSLLS